MLSPDTSLGTVEQLKMKMYLLKVEEITVYLVTHALNPCLRIPLQTPFKMEG